MVSLASGKKQQLKQRFVPCSVPYCEVHDLQPGFSMLVGYPGGDFEGDVQLLAYGSKDSIFSSFCTNGPQAKIESTGELMTLSTVIKHVLQKDMPFSFEDYPVTIAGEVHGNRVFLITPREWRADDAEICENGTLAGPYRIHGGIDAIKAVADGDRPEKMAVVTGVTQIPYAQFMVLIRNNAFGEIAVDDDLIFQTATPEEKWARAMAIHTGGTPLMLPIPYCPYGKGHDGILHPKWPN